MATYTAGKALTVGSNDHHEIKAAKELLLADCATYVLSELDKLADAGAGRWILDPEVDGVVGFVHADNPRRAYLVVYVNDADWEVGEDLDA